MQKCLKCGKDIKYIATAPGKNVACDTEIKRFVTENGRQVFGYLVHDCEEEKDAKEEDTAN